MSLWLGGDWGCRLSSPMGIEMCCISMISEIRFVMMMTVNSGYTRLLLEQHMGQIVLDGYFLQKLSLFFNFNSCFWALLALSHLLRLIFLVNHVGRGRQNWFLDLPPHVRYLKTTSKHGWFGGFHPLFLLLYYFSMLPNQAKTFKNLSIVFVLCMETLFSFVSLSFYHL